MPIDYPALGKRIAFFGTSLTSRKKTLHTRFIFPVNTSVSSKPLPADQVLKQS